MGGCCVKNCVILCDDYFQVFLVRKIRGVDRGQLYAMKVLKKATLKGNSVKWYIFELNKMQCSKVSET